MLKSGHAGTSRSVIRRSYFLVAHHILYFVFFMVPVIRDSVWGMKVRVSYNFLDESERRFGKGGGGGHNAVVPVIRDSVWGMNVRLVFYFGGGMCVCACGGGGGANAMETGGLQHIYGRHRTETTAATSLDQIQLVKVNPHDEQNPPGLMCLARSLHQSIRDHS